MSPGRLRVVVLGAGFGGLEVATRLSAALGGEVDVRLVDRGDGFVFGFSKLDVMFGRTDMARCGSAVLRFCPSRCTDGSRGGLGYRPGEPTRDSGLRHTAGRHPRGGARRRSRPGGHAGTGSRRPRVLLGCRGFGGARGSSPFRSGRVVVAVTSTPFKCPPAPSETALLLHEFLSVRGLRDRSEIAVVMPLPTPIPPSPQASEAILAAFAARGISWHPGQLVRALDPRRQVAVLADGGELGYDLLLGSPQAPGPSGCRGQWPHRGRLDPRRPADPPDTVPRRLRRRGRDQRRNAEGRRLRRRAGERGRRSDCQGRQGQPPRSPTTGAASATWSSATNRSPRSMSPSLQATPRTEPSKVPPCSLPATRRPSVLSAPPVGSAATGHPLD